MNCELSNRIAHNFLGLAENWYLKSVSMDKDIEFNRIPTVQHLFVSQFFAKPFVVRSPYSIILRLSMRSKCFLFKVANERLLATAVAAINKSAISICFLLLFNAALISTAILDADLSNDKT